MVKLENFSEVRSELYDKQKVEKPQVEDVLPTYVDGINKNIALDFIAYLKNNKMKASWAVTNAWDGKCKGKRLYYIRLPLYHHQFLSLKPSSGIDWKNSWLFSPILTYFDKYEDIVVKENLKNFVLSGIQYCTLCGGDNEKPCGAKERTIFSDKISNLCGGLNLAYVNPDETEIGYIKRLLELERQARVEVEQNLKEASFSDIFEGDALKYFADFHKFLTENKLTAKMTTNKWNVVFNGKQICQFKIIRKDYWIFTIALYKNFTDTETYEKYINADQRKFLLENFRTKLPSGCGKCKGYGKIEFLGNDYETVCKCYPIYTNSNKVKDDPSILEFMKQLTLVNKNVLEDMAAAQKAAKGK